MIRATGIAGLALTLATAGACLLPDPDANERPPFPQTAFLQLEPTLSMSTFGNLTIGEGERALYVGGNGGVTTWDVSAGGLTSITSVPSTANFPVFTEGTLLLPIPGEGVEAWRTEDDGRTWQVLGRSPFPANRARASGDAIVLSHESNVAVVDAAALRAGTATQADVRADVDVPTRVAGDAVLVDDVLFVGTDDGALAYDLSKPDNPALIGRVGDWFADRLLVYGDRLFVQSGYDTTVADISNPRDPVVIAHLRGGLDMVVRDDWLYALDRSALYITDLRGEPEQVRQVPLPAECNSVAATADAVFATCAGELWRLEPNTP